MDHNAILGARLLGCDVTHVEQIRAKYSRKSTAPSTCKACESAQFEVARLTEENARLHQQLRLARMSFRELCTNKP